jgi:hypothetical protein
MKPDTNAMMSHPNKSKEPVGYSLTAAIEEHVRPIPAIIASSFN